MHLISDQRTIKLWYASEHRSERHQEQPENGFVLLLALPQIKKNGLIKRMAAKEQPLI
jgi:hypothetical protein